MAKTNNAAEKSYKRSTKFWAVFLPIAAFLTLMISWSMIIEHNQYMDYSHYESCKLVDASAERQEDGGYIITVRIKNDSSYQTFIYGDPVSVEYGTGNRLENKMPKFAETDFLRSLNYPTIPSGRTVEYKIKIFPPEDISSVRLRYRGVSYERYKITGEEPETNLTVKLS